MSQELAAPPRRPPAVRPPSVDGTHPPEDGAPADRPADLPSPAAAAEPLDRLRRNLAGVIRGKAAALDLLLTALLARGSVLMDDVPGVGKTTLAKALARSLDLDFRRVQFTPDLLPADIVGSNVYNPADGTFRFRAGPIFCNVLLADEINRASPRTQSALLEAMGEGQVTVEGKSRPLAEPFFVLATQNPVDQHGTYPLPEAQLDRFLIDLNLGYPDAATEADILYDQAVVHPLESVEPVLGGDELRGMQRAVREVAVERSVAEYVVALATRTRADTRVSLGVSPRGSLMLFRTAQAAAYLAGRDFVLPDDVQRVAGSVLAHRLILTPQSRHGGTDRRTVLADLMGEVPVPV